ncbi:MAG: hypothetical protein LBS19_08510 [Clostridiales bacterium]|jgi:hypothetical protein|nr:hypothetical protein [Clostridiales bacterium]
MLNKFKDRAVLEILIILGAMELFFMLPRSWPLLFLVVPGILFVALLILSKSVKKKGAYNAAARKTAQALSGILGHLLLEQDIVSIAFGILERRITENVTSLNADARWEWADSHTYDIFAEDKPLFIMLNRTGGFRRAEVKVENHEFRKLIYEKAIGITAEELGEELDSYSPSGLDVELVEDEPVDYALIAFQWVDVNMLELNNRCNEQIAAGASSMLIPTVDLPHPDSWPAVRDELKRGGFGDVEINENGISVSLAA